MAVGWSPEMALRLIRATCVRKRAFRSLTDARRAARRVGDRTLVAYRCPADPSHSHLGHPPSLDDMEMIALAIRARTGCAPPRLRTNGDRYAW